MKKIEKNIFAFLFLIIGTLPLITLSLFLFTKTPKKGEINILELSLPTPTMVFLSPTPTITPTGYKIISSVTPTGLPKKISCADLCKSKGLTTKYAACGLARASRNFWCGPANDPLRANLCYYNIKNLGNPIYDNFGNSISVCAQGYECYCYDRVSCGGSNLECNSRCRATGCGPYTKLIPTGVVNPPPLPLP